MHWSELLSWGQQFLAFPSVSVSSHKDSFPGSYWHRPWRQMWGGLLRPLGCILPSAWTITAAEAILARRLQMPSDLACRMSANRLGLSLLRWPLACPLCYFLHQQAAAFPCNALLCWLFRTWPRAYVYSSQHLLFKLGEAGLSAHELSPGQGSTGKYLPQKALLVLS